MQCNRLISLFYIGLSPCVEKLLSPSGPTSPSGAASHDIGLHPGCQPRQRHAHSAGYPISHAPAESRSAGCGARRKAVRLSGRRHCVAPWASVKLPLRPAYPSKARACPWWSTSWAKARQAQVYPRAFPSREAQARAYPEASQPNPRPRSPSKVRACPWWSTSWAKARQAQAYPRACPSREAQAQAYPEASQPNPRPAFPSKARVLPA